MSKKPIKENILPLRLTPFQISMAYASEADVLNVALFGTNDVRIQSEDIYFDDTWFSEADFEKKSVKFKGY